MSQSVAGQIRIDLIAQTAKFNAGMREGSQSLGSFREEFERLNRSFDSQKNFAARMEASQRGWKAAVEDIRQSYKEYHGGIDRATTLRMNALAKGEGFGVDQSLRNQVRWKSMLPWGNTIRTELSREAAETAALIGAKKQVVVSALRKASEEIGMAVGHASGLGGTIFGLGRMVAGSPALMAGAGVAAVAGYITHQAFERDRLAREVKVESLRLGQTAEDTSRLMSVGMDPTYLSKFQRSLSEQSPRSLDAFNRLKLDPNQLAEKPLIDALSDVATAFDTIKNPADRANAAMALFGKSGAEMIATLARMKDKLELIDEDEIVDAKKVAQVSAYDRAWKGAANTINEVSLSIGRLLGTESGLLTHMLRAIEALNYIRKWDWEGFDRAEARWKKDDYKIAHAEELEAKKTQQAKLDNEAAVKADQYADAHRRAADEIERASKAMQGMTGGVFDDWFKAAYGQEALEEKRYREEAKRAGANPEEVESNIRIMRWRGDETTQINRANRIKDSFKESPEEEYQKNLSAIELWHNFHNGRIKDERMYIRMKAQALESYYKADDARRKKALDDRFREEDTIQKRLGIKNPLGDYEKAIGRLQEAFARKEITSDEYSQRRKELRKAAVGEMVAEEKSVTPIAAMQAGSREAYALLVNQQLNDPKIQLAKQTLAKLDKIEQNTRPGASHAPAGELLDF